MFTKYILLFINLRFLLNITYNAIYYIFDSDNNFPDITGTKWSFFIM